MSTNTFVNTHSVCVSVYKTAEQSKILKLGKRHVLLLIIVMQDL